MENQQIKELLWDIHKYAGTAGATIWDVRQYISNKVDEFPTCMTCGCNLETESELREGYCADDL